MVSESTLIGCENLPQEMAERFDQPWFFVGEISNTRGMMMAAVCQKCEAHNRYLDSMSYRTLTLIGHPFITDDMLEVIVYFGVCGECDSAHWARQGPPFKRARCLVQA